MANSQTPLPPLPRDPIAYVKQGFTGQTVIALNSSWVWWFGQLQRALSLVGGIDWDKLNKSGSKLSDIETRPHSQLQSIEQADDTSTDATGGKHTTNAQLKGYSDHVKARGRDNIFQQATGGEITQLTLTDSGQVDENGNILWLVSNPVVS